MNVNSDKKKMIVLGAAAVVLLAVVGARVIGAGGTSKSSASDNVGSDGRPVSLVDRDPKHLATVAKIARVRIGKSYEGAQHRDPMVSLVKDSRQERAQTESEPKPEPISLPVMSLYGVIWDPANPIALIDGLELHVGDRIKSATIVEIGMDRVVLTYKSRRFVLTVE